jgi:hypothetical protein
MSGKAKIANLKSHLKIHYNLTLEEYDNMYMSQHGSCAVCKTHVTQLNKRLAVDHDHDTGRVRGLLCDNCNRGLGSFKDNRKLLEQAMEYLDKFTGNVVKLVAKS